MVSNQQKLRKKYHSGIPLILHLLQSEDSMTDTSIYEVILEKNNHDQHKWLNVQYVCL